jgi:predicted transcriptional regulator
MKHRTKDGRAWTRKIRDSRIGVRLPSDLRKKVEKLAEQERRSMSEMVVQIVEKHFAKGEK